jgi:hypothetical protein
VGWRRGRGRGIGDKRGISPYKEGWMDYSLHSGFVEFTGSFGDLPDRILSNSARAYLSWKAHTLR